MENNGRRDNGKSRNSRSRGENEGGKYGKKVDKASKYYAAPDYYKKGKGAKGASHQKYDNGRHKKVDLSDYDDNVGFSPYERKSQRRSFKESSGAGEAEKKHGDGIRLNKYIANAGICSRREADTFIASGLVKVNGKIVTELGVKVMPGDEVRFSDERINPEKKVYILLNKPKGYVTTADDPEERKTVMDIIRSACPERVYPVGRLDRNTTGLLLFTNDGEITERLTHPSYNKKKIYQVETDKPLTHNQLQEIVDGFDLDDGFIAADAVSFVNNVKTEIGIEIHSGRNRIVRRIFEHFGCTVKRLDRVYYAGLTKLNLPRGKWRFLTEQEIIRLKTNMYE